jgi:hypothetical protein
VLLPSGIAPGDDIEIGIWWRAMSDPRYLRVWLVWEPPLSTVE